MGKSRDRISPATLFFALLSLVLGIALWVKTRAPAPREPVHPRPSASPRPRVLRSVPSPVVRAPAREPSLPRVGIVIDDLGNDPVAIERIARWPYPVAGAVLPALPGSVQAARALEQSGKEVLLHLPMEPKGYPGVRPGPGVVLRSQSDEEIAETLQSNLDSVPGAVGVNNHMGSAATADARVMRAVARVLARRGLFFVDSRTTDSTVAREVARQAGVPAISRRVFLDDVATEQAIDRSIAELVGRAKSEGSALAVGHPYPATLAVLERTLPTLELTGVRLVPVSELVK